MIIGIYGDFQQNFNYILAVRFIDGEKIEYPPVTTNLSDTDISFSLINLFTNFLMHFGQ
jgi:hypothetical protein